MNPEFTRENTLRTTAEDSCMHCKNARLPIAVEVTCGCSTTVTHKKMKLDSPAATGRHA